MRSTLGLTYLIQMILDSVLKFIEHIHYAFVDATAKTENVVDQIIGKVTKLTTSVKAWMYAEFSRWHVDTNSSSTYTMI